MKKQQSIALGLTLALSSMSSFAVPLVMEGDFVRTAVSDNGTLGYGGTTSPGLQHDPAGTGTFGVDDYLTPGSPFEGFSLRSTETGLLANSNTSPSGGSFIGGIVDNSAASAYDQSVLYTGTSLEFVQIDIDTRFNDGDERIEMYTTITALEDMSGVSFARWIDPDPDVNTYGSYDTVNGRGGTGLAVEDWVHSEGSQTGLTLGLYSASGITHDTGVDYGWSTDPLEYLAGNDDGDGDYTIGIGFDLGDMLIGDSITFTYYYVMGGSLDDVDIPGGEVPLPNTIALLGLGVGLLGWRLKKRA